MICLCSFSACFLYFYLWALMPLSTGQVERDRKPLGTETVGSGHDTGCLCVMGMCTAHCAARLSTIFVFVDGIVVVGSFYS